MLKILFLSLLFVLGLFVYSRQETWKPSMSTTFYTPYSLEGMTNPSSSSSGQNPGIEDGGNRGDCPNLLVQQGSKFYLYNKNQPEVEGENPLEFGSLEQYSTYINKQRMLGNHCPVLYVQQTMGAQGDDVYKVRATPEDPQGGMPPPQATNLPSSANFPQTPYDQKTYMDNLAQSLANNLSVSQAKNVDKLELTKSVLAQTPNGCPTNVEYIKPLEVKGKTADPMTDNWGGPKFSQELIDQGYYVGNEVFIAVP